MAATGFVLPASAAIPHFALYGEPRAPAQARFVHAETIASRSAPQNWILRVHRHADLHHLLVIDAGGGVMTAEAQQLRFGVGALLLVPAGTVHGFTFEPDTQGHVVTIADTVMQRLAGADPGLSALFAEVCVLDASAEELPSAALRDALVTETSKAAPLAELAAEALLQLLVVMAARAGAAYATAPVGRAARLVARYRMSIEAQVSAGWSVAAHAAALGVTPARLRAACVTVTGSSAIALLQARLLAEAQRQLAYGDRNIAEIGYALGFDDPAYFSRFFTRACGVPPGIWRRLHRAGTGALA